MATNDRDTISHVPNRYEVAKGVATDIIDVWHYSMTPDEWEFYQTIHNGSQFRLENLRKNAKKLNPNMVQSYETWYTNHGHDKS